MYCPTCNVPLLMADRQGVEINYCPTCRGVWIDRGGLDKIIDRSGSLAAEARPSSAEREQPAHAGHFGSEGRRRKSFFSDLFE